MKYLFKKVCTVCAKNFTATCNRGTCSKECETVRRTLPKKPVITLPCVECGTPVLCAGKNGRNWERKGMALCSDACRSARHSRISSETMAQTNRKYASARMTTNNPMHRDGVKERVSATLREMGHKPIVRGGNGKGPTVPESMIAEALGFMINCIVPTREGRDSGYPTHYKIDVANPELKIAVEADGPSHNLIARREQDAKKTEWLEAHGWKVVRFQNKEIIHQLDLCVSKVKALM